MIDVLVVALLVAIAVVLVIRPLRRGSRVAPDSPESEQAADAEARKDSALEAIVDLEGDRTMGKLSEPDFEALRADYESQALAALRELDALGELSARDRELEAEIAQVRARLRCPSCGGARVGSERCSRCGE